MVSDNDSEFTDFIKILTYLSLEKLKNGNMDQINGLMCMFP